MNFYRFFPINIGVIRRKLSFDSRTKILRYIKRSIHYFMYKYFLGNRPTSSKIQKSNKIQFRSHVLSIHRICKSSQCLLPFSFISVHLIITHPYPPNHLFTLYVTIFLLPTFQLGANESKYPHRFTTQIKFCKCTLFPGPTNTTPFGMY